MSGPSLFPPPPPPRGNTLRWAFAVLVAAASVPFFIHAKPPRQAQAPEPAAKPTPTVVAPPPEPKKIFFAISTSMGTYSYADAETRIGAETKALDDCRAKKERRFKAGAAVDTRDCEIRTVISNQPGFPSCVGLFTNATNYNITPDVMPGSDIDLYDRMRDYVRGNSYYQRKAHTVANLKNMMFCAEQDGTLYNRDVTYSLER